MRLDVEASCAAEDRHIAEGPCMVNAHESATGPECECRVFFSGLSDELEAWITKALLSWEQMALEEGLLEAVAHARRVIGGRAAGHWCDGFEEQREVARRFLAQHAEEVPCE